MAQFNGEKFVFHELFTNVNGKQSGSGFIGVVMGLAAVLVIVGVTVGWFLEMPDSVTMMGKAMDLALISAALLGIRKISGNFIKVNGNGNGSETNNSVSTNSDTSKNG